MGKSEPDGGIFTVYTAAEVLARAVSTVGKGSQGVEVQGTYPNQVVVLDADAALSIARRFR